MKKTLVFFLFCLCTLGMYAQTRTLKGSIVDSAGMPLSGANIAVLGSNLKTVADFDGAFQIKVPTSATHILVSFVGFEEKKVDISGKDQVSVNLISSTNQMQEVVVVGYGTQKKKTLTGAVGTLKGSELNKRAVASLSTGLQGTIAGVTVQQGSGEPGRDGSNIRIRGIGSINSSTFPLVLVDGVEMDINQVDMNTVESISVLKDAASASIYGSRAANGVVLITTKRGKSGKMRMSVESFATVQTPTNTPKVLKAADYLQAELNAIDNAGIILTQDQRAARIQEISDQRNFKPDNWNRYDTDWKAATLRQSALMSQNNLTLSGGGDDVKYFGAITSLNQGGLIENNNFKRINIRLNTDAKIAEWLKFSSEISYRKSTQVVPGFNSPVQIISKSLYMLPTLSAVRELDGNWGYGKNGDNPVANAAATGTNTIERPEILLNGTLTATPFKDFEFQTQYSFRSTEGRGTLIRTPYVTTLRGLGPFVSPFQDLVQETYSQNIRNFFRAQASYTKNFDAHDFKLMAGYQGEDNHFENIGASRNGFELDRYYLDNGDVATSAAFGGASEWAMASFYGRFNYTFADKYLFEATGRYDGSSRFTKGNQWGFFPSVSAGWVISKEKFMEPLEKYVSDLKLRASYGTLGNQDIGDYPYAATVNTGYSYWIDKKIATGVAQIDMANPNISWEKSRQINFGLDAGFFNRKLNVTFDYYIKDVFDMLMKYPVPYYIGLNSSFTNAGDMQNKGFETSLTYRDQIGDFKFNITGTLSNNENKVTRLYGEYSDRSVTVGYPVRGYWGYITNGYYVDAADVASSPLLSGSAKPGYVKYVKIDQSGLNPNQITERDKAYLGDPFPHYEYGLNIAGDYKNFDFTIFFQGVGKRDVFLSGIGLRPFFNGSNLFTHQLDTWTPDNPNAEYPILVPEANSADNFQLSDKWVKNGAYMRLKNVIIGYSLPKSFIERTKMDAIRFYVSGQNLFTISNFYAGYDPEVNYGGSLGGEFYPIMTTVTFGANFKF